MEERWSFNEKEGQSYTIPFDETAGAFERVLRDVSDRTNELTDYIAGKHINARLKAPIDSPQFTVELEIDFESRKIKVTRPPEEKKDDDDFWKKQKAIESTAEYYQGVIEVGEMRFGSL
jgi:hypothetical protein